MNILYAAAEARPLIKIGGLADVAGSLPKKINNSDDVDMRVILPAYQEILEQFENLKARPIGGFTTTVGDTKHEVLVYQTQFPESKTILYLLKNDNFFIYDDKLGVYSGISAQKRFIFFSKAIIGFLHFYQETWTPDILHINDWHTALAPLFLQQKEGINKKTKTLITVHNLPFQELVRPELIEKFGIDVQACCDVITSNTFWIFKKKTRVFASGGIEGCGLYQYCISNVCRRNSYSRIWSGYARYFRQEKGSSIWDSKRNRL